jgi:predicted transcriptional regulator
MSIVTITVGGLDEAKERLRKAFRGKAMGARISFATPELLLQVMTQKRWELLRTMVGAGPMAVREAARRLGRDVHAVHRDVHALLNAGVLRKTDRGQIVFPFDAVRAEFTLTPTPDEDDENPEWTDEDFARALPHIGGEPVSKASFRKTFNKALGRVTAKSRKPFRRGRRLRVKS